MKRLILPFVILAAAGALAAGCATFLQGWPSYQLTAQAGQGAVLFQMSEDVRLSDDYGINSIMVRWPNNKQAPSASNDDWAQSQHYRLPLEDMLKPTTTTALIALAPDSYPHTIVRFFFAGYEIHYIDLEANKPLNFTVTPGKVTVLGRFHLATNVTTTSEEVDKRHFSSAAHLVLDDSPKAKLKVIDDALARPEAASSAWIDALKLARRQLAAK